MNENEMCERCGEVPAVTLVERGAVGECVCADCRDEEWTAAVVAEIERDLFVDGPEEYCEGW